MMRSENKGWSFSITNTKTSNKNMPSVKKWKITQNLLLYSNIHEIPSSICSLMNQKYSCCVNALVATLTNRQALSNTEIRIRKRSDVTQISLKNFAWNIANQYNINGDATAAFVFNTFNEWFSNTAIATIKKNLRTTTGRHKIEIDEKILSKYLQN